MCARARYRSDVDEQSSGAVEGTGGADVLEVLKHVCRARRIVLSNRSRVIYVELKKQMQCRMCKSSCQQLLRSLL